ncbi:MAG: polysaccharide deacetylase family protein [Bacteroidota bacterium]
MNRRTFVKTTALASLATGWAACNSQPPDSTQESTHILSFSFDDGFKQSFLQIADIFESVDLRACFNVIASAHMPTFEAADAYILPELMGEWDTWNDLVRRGHEVMPHGWRHAWLNKLPVEKATDLIGKSIDYFVENLNGFDASKAVFNFPFNASTPELEAFTLSKIGALRTRGDALNPFPQSGMNRLTCESFGPDNIDQWVEEKVQAFLQSTGGWLILNTHGVDGEGWGPMSSEYLTRLLGRLVNIPSLEVLPVAKALFSQEFVSDSSNAH